MTVTLVVGAITGEDTTERKGNDVIVTLWLLPASNDVTVAVNESVPSTLIISDTAISDDGLT